MSELTDKILAAKRESRKQLAALPFAQKLVLVEKMRDRSLLIAASSLRRKPCGEPLHAIRESVGVCVSRGAWCVKYSQTRTKQYLTNTHDAKRKMMTQLANQIAVVTGAGLGHWPRHCLEIRRRLAGHCLRVAHGGNSEKVAAEVRALGRKAWAHAVDVSDSAAVTAAGEKILAECGRVDILCE